MKKITVILAICSGFIMPAIASSDVYYGPLYHEAPASYVYADALLREAAYVADIRWRNMGRPLPNSVELRVYDEPENPRAVAYGNTPGNTVWVARFYRDFIWETRNTRAALVQLCQVMVHERGHNLGLPHIAGTVMDTTLTIVPKECTQWSYWKLP